MNYEEECWACGCKDCICATKSSDYTKRMIDAAVLAEREACVKAVGNAQSKWNTHTWNQAVEFCVKQILARGSA